MMLKQQHARGISQRQEASMPSRAALTGQPVRCTGRRVVADHSGRVAQASRAGLRVQAVLERPTIQYQESTGGKGASTLAIILGGGAGSRLYPLTKNRAKPAVPIGGAYRLIDVPMSNCINSGINKIYILTQFNSTSLNRHLSRTYFMGNGAKFGGEGFVEVLAATQTPNTDNWFRGTADAVRQYSWLLEDTKNRGVQDVVILSGDHLYRMDYMKFVGHHRKTGADITIACIPYDASRASDFGLMKTDENNRVIEFAEKPKGAALEAMKTDTERLGLSKEEAEKRPYIASMGIYVFKKGLLTKLLKGVYKEANDFGGEIIPMAAKDYNVQAYLYDGYWEDIGTIKSFFEENLKLAAHNAPFEFYDPSSPIYTSPRFLPPAKVENCKVTEAIISHGVTIRDSTVDHAVVGLRSIIDKGCTIRNTLMIGADYYESDEQRAALLAAGQVPLGMGHNSHLENAIADKNVRIGANCRITNKDGVQEGGRESEGFIIKNGIMVLLRGATFKDNTVI